MRKRFTVTLDEDVVKRAKKKAIDENTNFSALVESCLEEHIHSFTLTGEEKEIIDAILSMGLERVNPDKYPKVMVHSVIYKILKYVYKKG